MLGRVIVVVADSGKFLSLEDARCWYRDWLLTKALPLWWRDGIDPYVGGFIEALSVDGTPRPGPRRTPTVAMVASAPFAATPVGSRHSSIAAACGEPT